MNEQIFSNILPSITAIAAILAPIITAMINNHHQTKIKKMELEQKKHEQYILHKREIFENFLSAFNEVCHLKNDDALSRYSSSYSLVYIYLPKPVRDDLGKVNLLIEKKIWDEAVKYVDAISMDISKELEKSSIK